MTKDGPELASCALHSGRSAHRPCAANARAVTPLRTHTINLTRTKRTVTRATGTSTRSLSTSRALALLVGGLMTPVVMGLSLALFPIGAAMLAYAVAGGAFAFRQPDQSWQWGLWVASGLLLASALALTAASIFTNSGLGVGSNGGFIRATLVFGLAPAVIGGCLGGASGSLLARKRYKLAGVTITVLIVVAVALPFIS